MSDNDTTANARWRATTIAITATLLGLSQLFVLICALLA